MGNGFGTDPAPGIAHDHFHVFVAALAENLDPAARGREANRVREQVPQDLLQALGISLDGTRIGIQGRVDTDSLCQRDGPEGIGHHPHELGERGQRLQLDPHSPGHDPRHVQQIVDQPSLHSCVAIDEVDGGGVRLVEPVALE